MRRKVTVFLMLVLCTTIAWAEGYTVETVPNPRDVDAKAFVCNPDEVLDADQQAELQSIAEKIHEISGVELCVVALNSIGDTDAYDFTYNLFNKWGIGDKEKNTGVMMLLAVESRDIQIITGGGVEGVLPDAVCGEILDEIIPILREDYGAGLIAASKIIGNTVTTDDAKAELMLGWTKKEADNDASNAMMMISGIFGLGYLFVYLAKPKCTRCQKRELKLVKRKVLREPTYTSEGKGEKRYVCQCCGEKVVIPFTIAQLVSASSGGGGGASFGGGGFRSGGGGFSGGSFGGGSSFGGGAGRSF